MKVRGKHVSLQTNIIKGRCPECRASLIIKTECGGMGTARLKCIKCTYTKVTEKPIVEWLKGE